MGRNDERIPLLNSWKGQADEENGVMGAKGDGSGWVQANEKGGVMETKSDGSGWVQADEENGVMGAKGDGSGRVQANEKGGVMGAKDDGGSQFQVLQVRQPSTDVEARKFLVLCLKRGAEGPRGVQAQGAVHNRRAASNAGGLRMGFDRVGRAIARVLDGGNFWPLFLFSSVFSITIGMNVYFNFQMDEDGQSQLGDDNIAGWIAFVDVSSAILFYAVRKWRDMDYRMTARSLFKKLFADHNGDAVGVKVHKMPGVGEAKVDGQYYFQIEETTAALLNGRTKNSLPSKMRKPIALFDSLLRAHLKRTDSGGKPEIFYDATNETWTLPHNATFSLLSLSFLQRKELLELICLVGSIGAFFYLGQAPGVLAAIGYDISWLLIAHFSLRLIAGYALVTKRIMNSYYSDKRINNKEPSGAFTRMCVMVFCCSCGWAMMLNDLERTQVSQTADVHPRLYVFLRMLFHVFSLVPVGMLGIAAVSVMTQRDVSSDLEVVAILSVGHMLAHYFSILSRDGDGARKRDRRLINNRIAVWGLMALFLLNVALVMLLNLSQATYAVPINGVLAGWFFLNFVVVLFSQCVIGHQSISENLALSSGSPYAMNCVPLADTAGYVRTGAVVANVVAVAGFVSQIVWPEMRVEAGIALGVASAVMGFATLVSSVFSFNDARSKVEASREARQAYHVAVALRVGL